MQSQLQFLSTLQKLLPEDESFVDLCADILCISVDSFYRRLRGKTALTFDEALRLAKHFNIPLEQGHAKDSEMVPFQIKSVVKDIESFKSALQDSLAILEHIAKLKDYFFVYAAKDIPVFYQYKYPKVATFKLNVWLRSVHNLPMGFDQDYIKDMPEDILNILKDQWEAYNRIEVNEIWNETTPLSLLRQIAYYYESGLIDKELALDIVDEVEQMYAYIQQQVASGCRMTSSGVVENKAVGYNLYYNEILIMDNHLLCSSADFHMFFVPYAGFNYMNTRDLNLVKRMEDYFKAQMNKASHLSKSGEKERIKFFRKMENALQTIKNQILAG